MILEMEARADNVEPGGAKVIVEGAALIRKADLLSSGYVQ